MTDFGGGMKGIFKGGMYLQISLWLVACASTGDLSRPVWIDNPGKGVSASAGMHVGGRVAQEELAVLRGREEYARRFGVDIQSEQIATTTVTNDSMSTVANKVTHEATKQSGIKVKLKEKWREPDSDVLWVWLVPSDQ